MKMTLPFYKGVRDRIRQDPRYGNLFAKCQNDLNNNGSLRQFESKGLIEPPLALVTAFNLCDKIEEVKGRGTMDCSIESFLDTEVVSKSIASIMVSLFFGERSADLEDEFGSMCDVREWAGRFDRGNTVKAHGIQQLTRGELEVFVKYGKYVTVFSQKRTGSRLWDDVKVWNGGKEPFYHGTWERFLRSSHLRNSVAYFGSVFGIKRPFIWALEDAIDLHGKDSKVKELTELGID